MRGKIQTATHVDLIHNVGELGVLLIHVVDGVDGIVKVLDVLRVHLEEGRELDDDVTDPLEVRRLRPLIHSITELGKKENQRL